MIRNTAHTTDSNEIITLNQFRGYFPFFGCGFSSIRHSPINSTMFTMPQTNDLFTIYSSALGFSANELMEQFSFPLSRPKLSVFNWNSNDVLCQTTKL